MKNHKDLDVWKLSLEFVAMIYRYTEKFPRHETYGLIQQLRRAAISIVSNISEGSARQSKREFVKFLYCSLGSSAEIEAQLELAICIGYISRDELLPLFEMRDRIAQMLFGLIRRWKE